MKISLLLRWTARLWGAVSVIFLGIMIVGHVAGSEPQQLSSWVDALIIAFFPGLLFVGLILGWKWELLGGIICLISMIGLYVLRPDLLGDIIIPSLAAPGLLFLIRGLWVRRVNTTQSF